MSTGRVFVAASVILGGVAALRRIQSSSITRHDESLVESHLQTKVENNQHSKIVSIVSTKDNVRWLPMTLATLDTATVDLVVLVIPHGHEVADVMHDNVIVIYDDEPSLERAMTLVQEAKGRADAKVWIVWNGICFTEDFLSELEKARDGVVLNKKNQVVGYVGSKTYDMNVANPTTFSFFPRE